jgi:hypothetical protein
MDFNGEPQTLDTGRFGQIQVVQTWAMKGKSISKLANGAFVHTTGLPISSKKEITEVIPPGPEQDEALYWFDHRHDEPEEQGRRIVMNPDGSFAFEDGTAIASITEITQALKPGPHQEVVIRWFIAEQEKLARTQAKQRPEWQKPAQEEEQAAAPKTAPKKKVVKKSAPKKPATPNPGPLVAQATSKAEEAGATQ